MLNNHRVATYFMALKEVNGLLIYEGVIRTIFKSVKY